MPGSPGGLYQYSCSEQYGQNLGVFGRPLMFWPQYGQLFHVSCDYLNQLGEHLLEHHGFVIDHTKTVLYGLCAACAKKKS